MPRRAKVRSFLENVANAKSLLPTRSRLRLFRSRSPHPTHRVSALEPLTEEDAEGIAGSSRRSPSAMHMAACRRPGSSAAPEVSAGTYDPLLLSNISHLQISTRRRVLPWPRMPQALDPGRSASILGVQCSCSLVESRDRACVSEPPTRWKRTGLYPLPTFG